MERLLLGGLSSSLLKTSAICGCTEIVTSFERGYRGRKTYNIGRTHGLVQQPKHELAISKAHSRKSERFVLDEFEDLMESTRLMNMEEEEGDLVSTDLNYGVLNFIVSGFDIVLVENFSAFLHRTMLKFKEDIVEVYALPTHDVLIKDANTNTNDLAKMNTTLTLKNHQRICQVRNVSALSYPIIVQLLMHNIPQSVSLEIKEHSEEEVRRRLQRSVELEREKEALQKLQDSV